MITNASLPRVYPRIINPVAISVPDLKEAVNWYTEVCGFTVVKQATEFVVDDSLKGKAVKDIHGPRLKKMRMAWLSSANQVGSEIIEYLEPKALEPQSMESVCFHQCIRCAIVFRCDPNRILIGNHCRNPFYHGKCNICLGSNRHR